ncbi:MAG: GNAT family N-acetyltransferase [Rhodanobacteraceae bacterium]
MALAIRDVQAHELDSILALNNTAGPTILPLDSVGIRWFFDNACYFRLAEVDGNIAGFLLALRENVAYTSPNYLWFREHCAEFAYIDRIVVARGYRRLGLGRVFYADVISYAELRVETLACEVFLDPHDDISILFHGSWGFREIGQQVMPDTGRRVSLLTKHLCSHAFVRDTYLAGATGQLPSLPWLTERPIRHDEPVGARAAGGA